MVVPTNFQTYQSEALPVQMLPKTSPFKVKSIEKKRPPTPFFELKAKNRLHKREVVERMVEQELLKRLEVEVKRKSESVEQRLLDKLDYLMPTTSTSHNNNNKRPASHQQDEHKLTKHQDFTLEHYIINEQQIQQLCNTNQY